MLVITGNDKGKSTGGFGNVARCVGHGYKAAVVQFIKGKWASGERALLEKTAYLLPLWGRGLPGKHKTPRRIKLLPTKSGKKPKIF